MKRSIYGNYTLILLLITIEYARCVESEQNIRNFGNSKTIAGSIGDVDYKQICNEKLCIAKCCNGNKYVNESRACVSYERILDFSDVPVYDKNIFITAKTVKEVFNLVPGTFFDFPFTEAIELSRYGMNNYITESGVLYVEFPNSYQRWIPRNTSTYCVDYRLPGDNTSAPEPSFWVVLDEEDPTETNIYFVTIALLVSSLFMVLVLIVYALLPELRNLCGLVLIAYVASLLGAFMLLALMQILSIVDKNLPEICYALTILIYFFFLAAFCWMNVMSFDIWWTFRGYAKARPIHRRGEWFKFQMYCVYAWGVPLAMTIILAILNEVDLSHKPWFITPKILTMGCFLEGGEKLVYLYVPMLILIICNWLFYLMTAHNVWRLSRGTAVLDSAAAGTPAAHRTHRHRLMLYLKLSIVMGISWVLEVVSFLMPKLKVWYISDAYNLLMGLSIFLIFVCKKKILVKLIKKYRGYTPSRWYPSSKSQTVSTTDSEASQETPLQVCTNPKGPAYYRR